MSIQESVRTKHYTITIHLDEDGEKIVGGNVEPYVESELTFPDGRTKTERKPVESARIPIDKLNPTERAGLDALHSRIMAYIKAEIATPPKEKGKSI